MTHDSSLFWTPVALSADVPPGMVIPATLPSGPVALWRTQSGHLSANGDRCPHRGMRLSHGFVRGETLSCIYHGWRYAEDGSCTHIPAHPDLVPPASIRCDPRVARECDGLIWIADATPDNDPQRLEGFKPLRSLGVAADEEALKTATQASGVGGMLASRVEGTEIRLLLSDLGNGSMIVIVLVTADASPDACIAVSRWAEVMRQKAELACKSGEES